MIGAFVGDVGSSLLILGPLFYTFTHSTHAGEMDHLPLSLSNSMCLDLCECLNTC